jgi:hypothetical protein
MHTNMGTGLIQELAKGVDGGVVVNNHRARFYDHKLLKQDAPTKI